MKKLISLISLTIILLLFCFSTLHARKEINEFNDYKFGIFIHWGLASGFGRTVWIPENKLLDIANKFDDNATSFDADEWCKIVKSSGARYIVLIAKHEDGFCLWPTRTTAFAAKRDYLGYLVKSAKKYELDVFFYYAWELRKKAGQEFANYSENDLHKLRLAQLKELVSLYNPKGIWIDNFAYPYGSFKKIIIELKQDNASLLIGEKNPQYAIDGISDYITSEHQINYYCAKELNNLGLNYEVCDRLPEDGENLHSGWFSYNKTVMPLTASQINYVSKKYIDKLIHNNGIGANYLLNITPSSSGEINIAQKQILYSLGQWIRKHSNLFYTKPTMENLPYGYSFMDAESNIYLYFMVFQEKGVPMFKNRSIYKNQLLKKFNNPLSYYSNKILSPSTEMIFFHKKGVAGKISLKTAYKIRKINKYPEKSVIKYQQKYDNIEIESFLLENGSIIKLTVDK